MRRAWLPAAALLAALLPGGAPADDLASLFTGPPGPVKLRDLGPGWLCFTHSRPYSEPPIPAAALLGGGGQASPGVYYTQGRQVTVGRRTLLVAYTVEPAGMDMQTLMQVGDKPGAASATAMMDMLAPRAGPDAPLCLELLDLGVVSLDGLQPYDATAEVARRRPMQPGMPILAAIMVPMFAQARQRARETVSLSNLRQIGLGIHMYGADHNKMPPMGSAAAVKSALKSYLRNDAMFTPATGGAYRFNARLTGVMASSVRATDVMGYNPEPTATGQYAVLFGDGSARMVGGPEWQQIRSRAQLP